MTLPHFQWTGVGEQRGGGGELWRWWAVMEGAMMEKDKEENGQGQGGTFKSRFL